MNINFAKAVASGNDFVIVSNMDGKLKEKIIDFSDFARSICKRKYSVGADGVLVLEKSKTANFKMRIFNPDGSEVDMCGNGIRCSAFYAHTKRVSSSPMTIETKAGKLNVEADRNMIKIKMTPPKDIKLNQNIGTGKEIVSIHTINTGVPHVVHFVDNIARYPVKEMGSKIRYHKLFEPDGTNADFVEVIDRSTLIVRTYERGVEDETLACGTGVVASSIISHLIKETKEPITVITKSKESLRVNFKRERNNFSDVYLEGKADIVFEGGINYV